jgi:phosphoglycolate phosphatase-like HAD superfamily hydrolase
MEIIVSHNPNAYQLKVIVFDFDGTLSVLRRGWEKIMEPMMLEMLTAGDHADPGLASEIRAYVDQSAGIQTIYQMQWLAERIRSSGNPMDLPGDPWWYKAEYNRRLMRPVQKRIRTIRPGHKSPDDYLVKGSRAFLDALKSAGILLFAASGTDHVDVTREASVLGVSGYFQEIIGAPGGKMDCSKERLIQDLITARSFRSSEVAVIGDGKVEIALGRKFGALTLGIASNEVRRCGVNPVKRERLVKAGAHAIAGDFTELDRLLSWLGIRHPDNIKGVDGNG